jgi:hypothetical protein
MTEGDTSVRELNPGIFQIRGLNGSSHSYVIKGRYMNVMIDSGSDQNFPVLERGLFQIGLKVRDINLVINSHEHYDHIEERRDRLFLSCIPRFCSWPVEHRATRVQDRPATKTLCSSSTMRIFDARPGHSSRSAINCTDAHN